MWSRMFYNVNLKKDQICWDRLLVVNWAQIHNQSLAAIADRGLLCTLHFRQKPQTELPAFCAVFLLSYPLWGSSQYHLPNNGLKPTPIWNCTVIASFASKILFIFRDREGRQKERERNIDVREKHWSVASHMCPNQDKPTTQASTMTRNWNRNLLVCGTLPNHLSHTSQGSFATILTNKSKFIMINQNVWCWTIRIVLFGPIGLCTLGFFICIKIDKSQTRAGHLYIKGRLPLSPQTLWITRRGCVSPACELFSWLKSLLFPHLRLGTFVKNKQRRLLPLHGLLLVSGYICLRGNHK